MSLLHAFTAVLTLLLFIVRLRCALAALYLGKRRSVRQQGSQHEAGDKPAAAGRCASAACSLELLLAEPKYKRDPEIDVDSEEIGYEPLL